MITSRVQGNDTATWEQRKGVWFCASASRGLKWMVGMENFETVKQQLKERGFEWDWIDYGTDAYSFKAPFANQPPTTGANQ